LKQGPTCVTTRHGKRISPPRSHAHCIACGERNPHSLKLVFGELPGGGVRTDLTVPSHHGGYNGLLHGGTIATLLDAAMTHCLFAEGIEAVTAELNVRYHHPVMPETEVRLTARALSRHRDLFKLTAELCQHGRPVATGTAKFLEISK
jgi:uncharacterized protein (TIGR00369 family)